MDSGEPQIPQQISKATPLENLHKRAQEIWTEINHIEFGKKGEKEELDRLRLLSDRLEEVEEEIARLEGRTTMKERRGSHKDNFYLKQIEGGGFKIIAPDGSDYTSGDVTFTREDAENIAKNLNEIYQKQNKHE